MTNPFSQAKDLMKLQKEAKQMQKKMRANLATGISKDSQVSITINGAQELIDIVISDQLLNIDQKKLLIKDIMSAYKAAQKELQRSMMKTMDVDQLKGMLGM